MPGKKKRSKGKQRNKGGGNNYGGVAKKIRPVAEVVSEEFIKILIHGRSASGKTTLACDFPKPLLIIDCKEKGTKSVHNIKDVFVYEAETFEEAQNVMWHLQDNREGYKTVVIDTVSQLQSLAIAEVLGDKADTVKGGVRWATLNQGQWGDVAQNVKALVSDLKDLDMHTVFLAQERVFTVEEDEEEDEDALLPEAGPAVSPSVAGALNASVDYAVSTFVRVQTKVTKDKKTKRKTRERIIEYCLRTGPHAYYYTKVRNPKGTPTPHLVVDPTFNKLEAIIKGDFKDGKTKKAKSKKRRANR